MMKSNLDGGELQAQSPDWEFSSSSSSSSSDHLDVSSMFASPARNPFQQSSINLDGTQSLKIKSSHIEKPQNPINWMLSDKPRDQPVQTSEASQQGTAQFLNFDSDESHNHLMIPEQLLGKSHTFAGASVEGTSLPGQSSIRNDPMFVEMNETCQDMFLRDTLPVEQEQQQQLNFQAVTEFPLLELQQQMYVNQNIMPPQLANSYQEEQQSLPLVQLLLFCGEAVAKQDFKLANRYLQNLKSITSPLGNPMERVSACFVEALNTLLSKPPSPSTNPITRLKSKLPAEPTEILKMYHVFYQTCPYIRFGHFTCNQTILEAFEGEEQVHIIDLDIIEGYQWVTFMQALASRPGGPPSLKITGIGLLIGYVRESERRLRELARVLHIPFEFHAIRASVQDLEPHMFTRKIGEALAINCNCCLHRLQSDTLEKIVLMIRDQAPNVVTVVEPEAKHDEPYFLARFLEALHYYSAVFDSVNATFQPESVEIRANMEKYLFGPDILDIVAYKGRDRVARHRRLHEWRKLMEGKGLKGLAFSPNAVSQAVTLLGMHSCEGYRLTEQKGCLILGWQDRAILAASAWRC